MLRSLLAAFIVAAIAAAVRARRAAQAIDPCGDLDCEAEYGDYSTDSYLLELSTVNGQLLIESRLPFLGTEWGQYDRTDRDDD